MAVDFLRCQNNHLFFCFHFPLNYSAAHTFASLIIFNHSLKKALKILTFIVITLLIGLFGLRLAFHEKEPTGVESPEAEQMAQAIYTQLNKTAWDSTQWVKWDFPGGHQYLWDKRHGQVRVRWDDQEVLLDLATQQGPAKKSGVLLSGSEAAKAVKAAYAMFCNDGFWLTAPFKLTDPGTQRSVVTLPDGRKGLKVSYDSGGVTPGDSYVWILDDKGIPSSFKMWVSILPVGGIEATWEQWATLPTGAKVATYHLIGGKVKSVVTGLDGGMGTPTF